MTAVGLFFQVPSKADVNTGCLIHDVVAHASTRFIYFFFLYFDRRRQKIQENLLQAELIKLSEMSD